MAGKRAEQRGGTLLKPYYITRLAHQGHKKSYARLFPEIAPVLRAFA